MQVSCFIADFAEREQKKPNFQPAAQVELWLSSVPQVLDAVKTPMDGIVSTQSQAVALVPRTSLVTPSNCFEVVKIMGKAATRCVVFQNPKLRCR